MNLQISIESIIPAMSRINYYIIHFSINNQSFESSACYTLEEIKKLFEIDEPELFIDTTLEYRWYR